ncbi:MAG TPA: hypothetical protein VFT22_18130 [Kofleriaceae bacterium]|nr:hypothetical protein [Kofleriaceae bacterium]
MSAPATAPHEPLDAAMVWGVWRRILREPALGRSLFEPELAARASELGLSPPQLAAALAYAATPHRTRWFIENYRFRLVSSFQHALETGAPMTARALTALGHDLRTLGASHLDATGWADHGPYVYTFCAEILEALLGAPLTAELPGLRDLIRLEAGSVALVRRLGQVPRDRWWTPSPLDGADLASATLHRTGHAAVVTTEHVLVPWLRDPAQLGRHPLEPGVQHLLIYLTSPSAGYKLAGIPARGAWLYEALSEPRSLAELRASTSAASGPDDLAIVARLCRYGAIAPSTR